MFTVGTSKIECLYSLLPPIWHLCVQTDKEGSEDSKGRGTPGPVATWLIYRTHKHSSLVYRIYNVDIDY